MYIQEKQMVGNIPPLSTSLGTSGPQDDRGRNSRDPASLWIDSWILLAKYVLNSR